MPTRQPSAADGVARFPGIVPATDDAIRWNFPFELGPDAAAVRVPPVPRREERARSRSIGLVAALVEMVVDALDDLPCYVEFSGGCDSSLVLAAATLACRRVGHDDPVPVTYRHPDLPDTDESAFQELVVSHLGIATRVVHDVRGDFDLVGPAAQRAMHRFGLAWPAPVMIRSEFWAGVPAGLVLTGEGGDESMGPRRGAALVRAVDALRGGHARAVAGNVRELVAPRPVRARRLRSETVTGIDLGWLAPADRERFIAGVVRHGTSEPVRPGRFAASYLARPTVRLVRHQLDVAFGWAGHRVLSPLMEPWFVHAVGDLTPLGDLRNRRRVLQRHAAQVLPSEIVNRTDKRVFGDVYAGGHTREFARRWGGRLTADDLGMDTDWLRDHWSRAGTDPSKQVSALTFMALQYCWLHAEGPR